MNQSKTVSGMTAAMADMESAAQTNEAAAEPSVAGESESGPDGASERAGGPVDMAALEQESEVAADYVEGLLDIADLDGDIDMDVEGDPDPAGRAAADRRTKQAHAGCRRLQAASQGRADGGRHWGGARGEADRNSEGTRGDDAV